MGVAFLSIILWSSIQEGGDAIPIHLTGLLLHLGHDLWYLV